MKSCLIVNDYKHLEHQKLSPSPKILLSGRQARDLGVLLQLKLVEVKPFVLQIYLMMQLLPVHFARNNTSESEQLFEVLNQCINLVFYIL